MPAVIVVPVGNSFQHPDLKSEFGEYDVERLADHLNDLDDSAFAAVTPPGSFHSWPSLKAAVDSQALPCRILLVATEQADGLPHDQGRDSKPLLGAVVRFLSRELDGEIVRPHVVIHPKHSLTDLVSSLEQYRAVWSRATAVYIMGGATRHVQEALAVAVPAMVQSGCPVMRPHADRDTHHGWEPLSASAADHVPVVALLLRALEENLADLAETILRDPDCATLTAPEQLAFEAAMRTPLGSDERLFLIETWSRPGDE